MCSRTGRPSEDGPGPGKEKGPRRGPAVMQLHIAEKAGFCFGVRRAIKMVDKALAGDDPV